MLANLVKNIASSSAESPPPTTAISWSLKKKPSQVAQVDRPCPINRVSASSPSMTDRAPVETYQNIEEVQARIAAEQRDREQILENLKNAELEASETEKKIALVKD